MSGTVVALNTVAVPDAAPPQVAAALHTAMRPYTSRSRMNIAFCYTLLSQHVDGWSLRAVGAGAVPPLVRRASGEVFWLDTAGFPLGALAADRHREVSAQLVPGDILLLLSDGVIESMNAARDLFGFDRTAEVLTDTGGARDAHATLKALIEAVRQHTGALDQHDDITIVVVRVLAGAAR